MLLWLQSNAGCVPHRALRPLSAPALTPSPMLWALLPRLLISASLREGSDPPSAFATAPLPPLCFSLPASAPVTEPQLVPLLLVFYLLSSSFSLSPPLSSFHDSHDSHSDPPSFSLQCLTVQLSGPSVQTYGRFLLCFPLSIPPPTGLLVEAGPVGGQDSSYRPQG